MRIGFAGDRDISVQVLEFIKKQDIQPLALFVSEGTNASHAEELITLSGLKIEFIFKGKEINSRETIKKLEVLKLDYIIGIHFPYVIKKEVLQTPKFGFLNLHPAYLPYNKGWHTPSWGILENTPIGGTLHFMSEELDAGAIIHQKKIQISPNDTANTLYARLKAVEYDVFVEAWSQIMSGVHNSRSVTIAKGTSHRKKELFAENIQELKLDQSYTAGSLIDTLRALTTSEIKEAAYFVKDGERYRIQINIVLDEG